MSFLSSIKSFARTVNENKANIVEAATHIAVFGYVLHQDIKNPSQETTNMSIAWITGAIVGATHGLISEPGNTLHIDPTGNSYLEEDSRIAKGGVGLWRGATVAVLGYKAGGLAVKYAKPTTDIIGDIVGDTTGMIA